MRSVKWISRAWTSGLKDELNGSPGSATMPSSGKAMILLKKA